MRSAKKAQQVAASAPRALVTYCRACGGPVNDQPCPARSGEAHVSARALRVGDLVSAGNARDNDYDTGKVVEVLATGEVYVRWRVARATYLEQPEVLTLHLTRLSRAGDRTEAQDDGRACVRCGAVGSAMVPTGARGSRGAQLFECVPVDVSLLLGK